MAHKDASLRSGDSNTTTPAPHAPQQSAIAETSSAPLQSPNKPDIYQKIENWFRLIEHVIKQLVQLIKQLEVLAYTAVSFLGVLLILYYALHQQVADVLKELLK